MIDQRPFSPLVSSGGDWETVDRETWRLEWPLALSLLKGPRTTELIKPKYGKYGLSYQVCLDPFEEHIRG